MCEKKYYKQSVPSKTKSGLRRILVLYEHFSNSEEASRII
jgi:hypothetical protein